MNKSFIASAVAAATLSLAAVASTPATAAGLGAVPAPVDTKMADNMIEKAGRRWRRRGIGIGAGLLTLGIIGAIASKRAHSRRYHYRDRHWRRCNRWRRRCNHGNNRACWKYDTRC